MSKQKNKIENEEKDARFRRVVESRILKMIYQTERITEMTKSPSYTIYDVDADTILKKVMPIINEFIEAYTNIANNTKPIQETKEKINKIF